MRVLGWDPGSRWIAWALLDVPPCGPALYLDRGTLDTDPLGAGSPLWKLSELRVQHVAVELVAKVYNRPGFSTDMASELAKTERVGGLIVGAARMLHFTWSEPAAPEWRKQLCGDRQAEDSLIQTVIEARVQGLPKRTNKHERDAMGVAIYAGITQQLQRAS
jgi:Holliday junction resolvasome RuvABC endonuclease subunit